MVNEPHDVIRSGAELVDSATGRWITPADVTGPLVILVHGFTAHGRYMANMATYLRRYGYVVGLFNYDSHRGIDVAASALVERLDPLKSSLAAHGCAILGHSMGGLVARAFLHGSDAGALSPLRGIALLGTPNRGTLAYRAVGLLLEWAEALTEPNPFARSVACRAVLQLTSNDSDGVVASLNRKAAAIGASLSVLSISGGLNFLEFGNSDGFGNKLRNRLLQAAIGEMPNDGLVGESSANVSRLIPAATHENGYADYRTTNHTHLVQNQGVADRVIRWLIDIFRRATIGPVRDSSA